MSYRCELCNEAQETGAKPNRLVLSKRTKNYSNEVVRRRKTHTIYSNGWEIERECIACNKCARSRDE